MDDNEHTAANTAAEHLEALIERWWDDHFPGSAVARHSEAWNVAHAAKEALKRLLAQAQDRFSKGSV